jgi:hypothetical protein
MDVVAHDAESIELKPILVLCFLHGIKKYLSALQAGETKLPIIAASSDVVAISRLKLTGLARHW